MLLGILRVHKDEWALSKCCCHLVLQPLTRPYVLMHDLMTQCVTSHLSHTQDFKRARRFRKFIKVGGLLDLVLTRE